MNIYDNNLHIFILFVLIILVSGRNKENFSLLDNTLDSLVNTVSNSLINVVVKPVLTVANATKDFVAPPESTQDSPTVTPTFVPTVIPNYDAPPIKN